MNFILNEKNSCELTCPRFISIPIYTWYFKRNYLSPILRITADQTFLDDHSQAFETLDYYCQLHQYRYRIQSRIPKFLPK